MRRLWSGSQKLLPGHCLRVDASGVQVDQWYDLVKASKASAPIAPVQETLFRPAR